MQRNVSILDSKIARWILFFLGCAAWTFLSALKREGAPARVVNIPLIDSIKFQACIWFAWGLLTPLILAVDKRLPVRRDALITRFILHIPLSMIFITGYTYIYHLIAITIGGPVQAVWLSEGPFWITLRSFTRPSNLVYWVIVGISISFEYQRFLRDEEVRAVEAERLMSEAQLSALRAQLHPHFLFNALNCVGDYVDTDPKVARWMLENLGYMLRMLTDNIEMTEITLAEELGFLELYLNMQMVRFGDRLTFEITSSPDALNALVPPLVLQPIVENAIVHGPLTEDKLARVTISAITSPSGLCLRVADNGPGFARIDQLDAWAGIGLLNTKKRLQSLYAVDLCSLTLSNAEAGGAIVELSLPLRMGSPKVDAEQPVLTETV